MFRNIVVGGELSLAVSTIGSQLIILDSSIANANLNFVSVRGQTFIQRSSFQHRLEVTNSQLSADGYLLGLDAEEILLNNSNVAGELIFGDGKLTRRDCSVCVQGRATWHGHSKLSLVGTHVEGWDGPSMSLSPKSPFRKS